jgi:hypothetical protein
MFGIRKSRLDVTRKAWIALSLVTVAEGVVNCAMLGFYVCDWRADLLFSEWMDRNKV